MIDSQLQKRLEALVAKYNLRITRVDNEKPWGGEFYFDEDQVDEFAAVFFPGVKLPSESNRPKMSPKFLIVGPHQRLSWQYHHRRSEQWCVLEGPVGVITSSTDEQGPLKTLQPGDQIEMGVGERHTLIGLDSWGVVPEIWKHADLENPSDTADIVRLEDNYGRKGTS